MNKIYRSKESHVGIGSYQKLRRSRFSDVRWAWNASVLEYTGVANLESVPDIM